MEVSAGVVCELADVQLADDDDGMMERDDADGDAFEHAVEVDGSVGGGGASVVARDASVAKTMPFVQFGLPPGRVRA